LDSGGLSCGLSRPPSTIPIEPSYSSRDQRPADAKDDRKRLEFVDAVVEVNSVGLGLDQ
jgi:hypothetical protein